MKSLVQLEQEAEKMVDALEVVFTLSRGLMPMMGFEESEIDEIFIRAARKLRDRHDGMQHSTRSQ